MALKPLRAVDAARVIAAEGRLATQQGLEYDQFGVVMVHFLRLLDRVLPLPATDATQCFMVGVNQRFQNPRRRWA